VVPNKASNLTSLVQINITKEIKKKTRNKKITHPNFIKWRKDKTTPQEKTEANIGWNEGGTT